MHATAKDLLLPGGSTINYFVHESAYVDSNVVIGNNTKIWHFCHIISGAVIGERCVLGQNVCVLGTARIGNGVKIQNNVSIYDAVVLEDDVFCGPSCVFTNVVNPRAFIERKHEYRATVVRRGASLGANCTIVCGYEIGEYAFIGAGAVVTSNVPAYALMKGVPARPAGWVCACGVRLDFVAEEECSCRECQARYRLNADATVSCLSTSASVGK
jgi:UDP-2-acetamido-3-amino-2,3-dideoxy-glucuronate N-acetyltransferase